LVCVLVMCSVVSLATGKFPPPIKEVYQNIRGAQASLNIANSTAQFARAKEDQQKVLDALDQASDVSADQRSVARDFNRVSPQEKIKELEYEVALLKAKLARAQWEVRQLQSQQQPSSAQR